MNTFKKIALTLLAAALPCLGWGEVVYTNTLAGSETLEYNGVAYEATAFTKLINLAEDDTNKFDKVIYKVSNNNDTQTHTFSMWVKVPTLTDNQILWWVCGGSNAAHGGYAVKAMSNGSLKVGKTDKDGGWTTQTKHENATENVLITTSEGWLKSDTWAHLVVVITKGSGRSATVVAYVDGSQAIFEDGSFSTNLNGNGGADAYAQIGSGISAAGVCVYDTALTADEVAALNPMANLTPVNNTWTAKIATDGKYLWSEPTNWSSGSVPESNAEVCILANGTNGDTLTMTADVTVGTVHIIGTETLTIAGTKELKATNINVDANTIVDATTISSDAPKIQIFKGKTLTIDTANATTDIGKAAEFSGAGTLVKKGDKKFTLWANNSTDALVLNSITLDVQAGAFEFNGYNKTPKTNNATIKIADGTSITNAVALTCDGITSIMVDSGAATAFTADKTVTLNGAFTKSGAGTLTIPGILAGSKALNVNEGTLTLTAANTRTGDVTVASGATLDITGANVTLFANSGNLGNQDSDPLLTVNGTLKFARDWAWGNVLGHLLNYTNLFKVDGGTLIYSGEDFTTDRFFSIGENGATIQIENGKTITFKSTDHYVLAIPENAVLKKTGTGTLVLNDIITGAGSLVVEAGTVTSAAAHTYAGGTTIAEDATVNVNNASALGTGTITGAGTAVISAVTNYPAASIVSNDWTGTVKLSGTWENVTDLALSRIANTTSTIEIPAGSSITGGLISETADLGALTLDGTIELTNGYSAGSYTFNKALTGSGTLSLTNDGVADVIRFLGGVSGFNGMLSVAGKRCVTIGKAGTAVNLRAAGYLVIDSGVTVAIPADKTWTANIDVFGTLSGPGTFTGDLILENNATLDATYGSMNVNTLTVRKAATVKLMMAYFPAEVLNLATAATADAQYPVTVKVGDAVQTGTYALQVTQGKTEVNVVKTTTVITEPTEVPEVPAAITIDPNAFGYGTHTVLTYTGDGEATWTGMTYEGLPEGATVVTTGTTWGFTNSTLKVLPIGDSITAGLVTYDNSSANFHVPGGYRLPLYQYLVQAYGEGKVKYLGTSSSSDTALQSGANSYENNTAVGLGDQIHHEGHSGAFVKTGTTNTGTSGANGIYERFNDVDVVAAIAAQGTPDVITIHLGTNDLAGDDTAETTFAEMKQLIYLLNGAGDEVEGITPLYPNAKIFVAKIMARNHKSDTAVVDTKIVDFNADLTSYVTGDVAKKVVLVDLQTDLSYGLMRFDWLHPSTEGYSRMAQSWFAAIEADEDVAPMDATETIASVDSRVAGRLTVVVDKALDKAAAETVANWTLSGDATVTAASLAKDMRTVTLNVTGVVSNMEYTLTASNIWTNPATKTFTPTDIHVPTKDVAECDPTTDVKLTDGVLKAAEWTTFTGLTKGTPYTSPIGYMPESGRAWQLDVRGDVTPNVTDGVLALNGAPLTVNSVDGRLGTTASRHTIVMEVSNLAASDVLITESTVAQAAFISGKNRGSTNPDLLKLTVQDATTLLWTDGTTEAVTVSLESLGVNLTDDVPETIALSARWVSGNTCSLMVNGSTVATLAIDSTPSESYLASWSIGALSTATTGSATMKLHRLSFYEGNVTGFVTDTAWTGIAGDGLWSTASNWTNGIPTATKAATIPAGASITLTANAEAKSLTLEGNVSISGTHTLTVTDTIEIAKGETLTTTNMKLAATVSGDGTLHIVGTVYSGHEDSNIKIVRPASITGLTADAWTGNVIFDSIAINNLNLSHYGNTNSTITLRDLEGGLDHNRVATNNIWGDWQVLEIPANICIDGPVTLTDGYSNQVYEMSGAITGDGSLVWKAGSNATGVFCFTGDISGFTGDITDNNGNPIISIGEKIDFNEGLHGSMHIYGEQEINCTLKTTATTDVKVINVCSDATISGSGAFASKVEFDTDTTVDVTNSDKLLTVGAASGTVNVKLPELTGDQTEDSILPANVFKFTDYTIGLTVASATFGTTAGSNSYKFAIDGDYYTITLAGAVCRVGDITYESLTAAVNAIQSAGGVITLTDSIEVESTIEIDIGDDKTINIALNGNSLTAKAITVIKVISGTVNLTGTGSVYTLGTNVPAIAVEGKVVGQVYGEDVYSNPSAIVGEQVTVTANSGEAITVVNGTVGGRGTINSLTLGDGAVIDASAGPIFVEGAMKLPEQIEEAGEMRNAHISVILPANTAGFPALFATCEGASAEAAALVTLSAKRAGDERYSQNDEVCVMADNVTGRIIGYGVMQYVCKDQNGKNYMTVADALAADATSITLFEDTTEHIVVPEGVTLILGEVLTGSHAITGNVTIESGATLVPFGGTINGNLVLESGATLSVSAEFENPDSVTFTVMGDVTFPTGGTLTVIVDSDAATLALGVPRQIIASGTLLEPGNVVIASAEAPKEGESPDPTGLHVVYQAGVWNYDSRIVATTASYELVTKKTGPCSFDGIDYGSIEDALAAYADATADEIPTNETIKLNKPTEETTVKLDQTIVINVGEGNTVSLDLNGLNLTSTADPAIRIESGNLVLISDAEVTVSTVVAEGTEGTLGTTILVGASENDGTASDTACGLYIGKNVTVSTTAAKTVDVINGGISGEGRIDGNLTLADGSIVDATHGVLTMAEGSTITFPGTVDAKGTIKVMPLAGDAYPSQFIVCSAANTDAIENVNLKVILNDSEVTDENFKLVVKYELVDSTNVATGYAVNGTGIVAISIKGDTIKTRTQLVDAVNDAGSNGQVILTADVVLDSDYATNIYTSGHNITINADRKLTGTLTLMHGTIVTMNEGATLTVSALNIIDNAEVTVNGTIAANSAISGGTLAGTATINGLLNLTDGAAIAAGATVTATEGIMTERDAVISIDGTYTGSLTIPNATVNTIYGGGKVIIPAGNTLAGAGTLAVKTELVSGAIINKIGYEANHLVIPDLALTADADATPSITVKANDLAHVINTKGTVIDAANFEVDMTGSNYVVYNATEPQSDDTYLVAPVVAVNNGDYTLGIVKINYRLAGVDIKTAGHAQSLAAFAYSYGVLEVMGVYNNREAFQCFSNLNITGFTSGGYANIGDYDFGVAGVTVATVTTVVGDGENAVATTSKYVVVTAQVLNADKTAAFRDATDVVVNVDGEEVDATEITAKDVEAYGLVLPEVTTGLKFFAVPYALVITGETADGSETAEITVKAVNAIDAESEATE